jgi:hypothetical protein
MPNTSTSTYASTHTSKSTRNAYDSPTTNRRLQLAPTARADHAATRTSANIRASPQKKQTTFHYPEEKGPNSNTSPSVQAKRAPPLHSRKTTAAARAAAAAGAESLPTQPPHQRQSFAPKLTTSSMVSSPSISAILDERHAMLSYNWDNQDDVRKVRAALEAEGVRCWMDIDHMKSDIYDSMAEGVQGAACVICFMTQAYQESANCKLELKFAQQSGVPIVPVMLAPDWRASDWLGIVTAGALWTALYSGDFKDSIRKIIAQIRKNVVYVAPANTDESSDEYEEVAFSVDDMRGELQRLMADLHVAKGELNGQNAQGSATAPKGTAATTAAVGSFRIPAGVPFDPSGLRVTAEMKQLHKLLLSANSAPQIGFCGMGGIGKTTISTWLVRDDRVRAHFTKAAWVTFGQTPNLLKCQAVLYLQLTGNQISKDMSPDEVQEALKNAFAGQNVLLILDDVWELEHHQQFNFIDDSTGSKVLMSSRVRGVLDGGKWEVVDITMPSDADAIQILLNEAGMKMKPSEAPPEAAEVVRFCNNLPLALGIAGSFLKKVQLDGDWSEVLAVLKDEFGTGGQVRSMENSVIRTSLRSIKGRQREHIIRLFCGFALIPEDTAPPLEVLRMMYDATPATIGSLDNRDAPGSSSTTTESQVSAAGGKTEPLPPQLLIRKWLKLLIDRSLILGTVDRPQLHDIVLEYVVSQFSPAELRASQQRLVNCFRANRPYEGWIKGNIADRVSFYIAHDVCCSFLSESLCSWGLFWPPPFTPPPPHRVS